MATSKSEQWTVMIIVEEDEDLSTMFRMSPDTGLVTLMQLWKDEFNLSGYWFFLTINGEILMDDDWMTIEMIEESRPHSKIVTLKAELFDETVREIFVFFNEKCHHVKVKSHQKLLDVVWPLTGRVMAFEYNGCLLNLKDTIKRAGLVNKAIIYESVRQISVKLSSGDITTIRIPSDSIVYQLMERVNAYEVGQFSLKHNGRFLHFQETIKGLTDTVEVTTAEFVVHFKGRCVTWRTKSEPVTFSEFIFELSEYGDIDMKELEKMEFCCIGCRRRIWNSRDAAQYLPIKCCKEMSLTLSGVSPSDTVSNAETSDLDQYIRSLYEHLLHCKVKNPRPETLRSLSSEMKDKCLENNSDYNLITELGERLKRSFTELENTVKVLEVEIEAWKAKNVTSEKEIDRLKTTNMMSMEENATLKDGTFEHNIKAGNSEDPMKKSNRKLGLKIQKLENEIMKSNETIETLMTENKKLRDENGLLKDTDKNLKDKIDENLKLRNIMGKLEDDDRKFEEIITALTAENKTLKNENELLKDENILHGEKLKELNDKNRKSEEEILILKYEKMKTEKNATINEYEKNKSEDLIKKLEEQNKMSENDILILKYEKKMKEEEMKKTEDLYREFEKKIKDLEIENVRLKAEIEVRLFVLYDSFYLKPVSRSEVEEKSSFWFGGSYIKCHVSGIHPGWNTFESVRDSLSPLFTRNEETNWWTTFMKWFGPDTEEIKRICQYRGCVDERDMVQVTTISEDRVPRLKYSPFCSVDGEQFSYEEAERPEELSITARGRIFISGGRRRTILKLCMD